MTDEVRKYASPRPWKVRRATWGGVLIMDATGEAIASMDAPAPEIALADAALIVEGVNALAEKDGAQARAAAEGGAE